MKNLMRILGVALLLGAGAATAFAGGPNYTFDHENGIPYSWVMERWSGGAVPVYTDLGNLKNSAPLLTNERADQLAVAAWAQWSNVPTSTFRAEVVGDLSLLGFGDITKANALQILGPFNGGGVHVIYDTDGLIMRDVLGAAGVLGIAVPEWVMADSPEIVEAWVVLNGSTARSSDPNGVAFGGVFTHEFGHVVNLAHSQVNGAILRHGDPTRPRDCAAPWSTAPSLLQVETMYPFLGIGGPTDSGAGMATVDRLDEIAAISDLYPAAGWPENFGTIRGTVSSLLNIRGNGTGDMTEVTGVNVVARNVADPFNDFTSAISGFASKGQVGPDGSFELNGLTPGASYVLYLDNLMSGAYSYMPRLIALPGPEEYYNGALESGDGRNDDRCAWTAVTATPGAPVAADITFNRVKGGPALTWLPTGHTGSDMTPDGSKVVGVFGEQYFVMDVAAGTIEYIGGYAAQGGNVSISDDGTRIAGNYRDATLNQSFWGVYENGAWTALPPRPGAVSPCVGGTVGVWGTVFGLSGDGSTVVGGTYGSGCGTASFDATKWTVGGGMETLAKSPDSPTRSYRANGANYDGSVIIGWDDHTTGIRRGAYWVNGVQYFFGTLDPNILFVGEGHDVTGDGSTIVGQQAGADLPGQPAKKAAWRYSVANQTLEMLSDNTNDRRGAVRVISDDAKVLSGWTDLQLGRLATIFTDDLGWTPFKAFLNAQGTWYEGSDILNANGISSDGSRIMGNSATFFGNTAWVLDTPKVVLCHRSPDNPGQKTQTLDVTFPDGLGEHLAHGDAVGLCQHGGV
jgi:hypothetical protein